MSARIRLFKRVKQRQKLLLTQFILAFSVIFADKVIALSVGDYCLSKVKPSEFKMALEKNPYKLPNEIKYIQTDRVFLNKNGKKYSIKIDNRIVKLVDEENNSIISQSELPYEKDSPIKAAYLAKDNWLYVRATKNNYAVKVDLENPSSSLKYKKLPKVYLEQCTRFSNWLSGGCRVKGFSLHSSSNKVFLAGHQLQPGGRKWLVMEIAGGETKILNTSERIETISHFPELNGFIFKDVKGGIFFYDGVDVKEISSPEPVNLISSYISKLSGVLLRGTEGAILYFDGLEIKEISSPFPRQKRMRYWSMAKFATFEEDRNNDERILLSIPGGRSRKPRLVTELKAGLLLEPVSFPQETNGTSLNFFRFPDDSLSWAIANNFGILAEIDGKFQNVVIFSESNNTSWKFPLTAPITFKVENSITNKSEQYYLKKASPSANCEIKLDPDNPVKLNVD